jgi:hypothetical protein
MANGKKKDEEKKAEKKERKQLPALKDAAAEQMKAVEAAGSNLLATINKSEAIPVSHLRRYFTDLAKVFRDRMTERRGDPVARKKAALQERLAKIQAQLAGLDEEKKK